MSVLVWYKGPGVGWHCRNRDQGLSPARLMEAKILGSQHANPSLRKPVP